MRYVCVYLLSSLCQILFLKCGNSSVLLSQKKHRADFRLCIASQNLMTSRRVLIEFPQLRASIRVFYSYCNRLLSLHSINLLCTFWFIVCLTKQLYFSHASFLFFAACFADCFCFLFALIEHWLTLSIA